MCTDAMFASLAEEQEHFRSLMTLGENLVPFFRGEDSPLQLDYTSRILNDLYKTTFGIPQYNSYLAAVVEQLAHKSRQMEILEIGRHPPF